MLWDIPGIDTRNMFCFCSFRMYLDGDPVRVNRHTQELDGVEPSAEIWEFPPGTGGHASGLECGSS
jgi:hypothetical protein